MKDITFISAITLLLFVTNMQAQNVAPFKLGNIWVYDEVSNLSRTTVVDTSVYFDTIAYCKLYRELNYGGLQYYKYARLRDDNFYVLFNEIDSSETHIYYKKNATIGDTWTIGGTTVYTIEDTFVISVFGEQATVKLLTRDNGLVYIQEYWTEKFGKLSSQDFGGIIDDLQGCVIDGIVYGDTSFIPVGVEEESETPNSFYLAQNYPNPFNPITNIEYVLPEESFINLTVYNSLGEEISVLVDEYQKSGKHIVQFSTNDIKNLSSGVYFYSLKANNNITTKKMVLLY